MITQKELQEIALKEQERLIAQKELFERFALKERDFNGAVKQVEEACKEAAYKGLFEINYRIPPYYNWIIHRLISKLNEAGLTVKSADAAYELDGSLIISWEAT